MEKIKGIHKETDHKYLNLYSLDIAKSNNGTGTYQVASRAARIEDLKLVTKKNTPNGVIIYSLYGEKKDRVVLIRQYRYSLDDYIYEFPAGLVDEGENYHEAGIRELKEETGLSFTPVTVGEEYQKPFFTTVGMTDESCATVYGYASGEPSRNFQEETEEIEIVLADKKEVLRILKEENVAIMCAYMLMHFLNSDEGKAFDFLTPKQIEPLN